MRHNTPNRAPLLFRIGAELLPLLVILVIMGVLVVPMARNLDVIPQLSQELTNIRHQYYRQSMTRMAARLTGEPVPPPGHITVPEIPPPIAQLGRFFPELDREFHALLQTVEVVGQFSDPGEIDTEQWITRMLDVDQVFADALLRIDEIETWRSRAYRSIGSFSLLLAFTFLILYGYQTAKTQTAARQHAFQHHTATLVQKVQEDERKTIARDLHDGTAQELAIARMVVDRIADSPAKQQLQHTISRTIDEIRFISYRLHPLTNRPATIAEMVQELSEFYERGNALQFTFVLDRTIPADWPDDAMLHLYRITQEAISNVVRHTRADRIHIILRRLSGGDIELSVKDNGQGIGTAPEGFGRQGMRERAELLGGSIEWITPRDGGTKVKLVVPPVDYSN